MCPREEERERDRYGNVYTHTGSRSGRRRRREGSRAEEEEEIRGDWCVCVPFIHLYPSSLGSSSSLSGSPPPSVVFARGVKLKEEEEAGVRPKRGHQQQ